MKASELAVRLREVVADWTVESLGAVAAEIAGGPAAVVKGGRHTYELPGGGTFSMYRDGETVLFVEATLAHRLSRRTSDEEEAAVEAEFRRRFEDAVAETERELGPPVFKGEIGEPRYPSDQDALCLAVWPAPIGRIMVQMRHEDNDAPFRLCVAASPAEVADESFDEGWDVQ